jgi:hypothetical protein
MPSYAQLKAYRTARGLPWFTKAHDLNLFVLLGPQIGAWDDHVVAAFTDTSGREIVESYPATADASAAEWIKPTNPAGCWWTRPQHVPGAFVLGESKGRPALRQAKPFEGARWPGGSVPTPAQLMALPVQTGLHQTHIHGRVSHRAPPKPEPGDSQACTVLLYTYHLAALVALVQAQAAEGHGDKVSCTWAWAADI